MLPITVTQGRVLPAEPLPDLDAYLARGGGRALPAARAVEPAAVIRAIADAGLRGRGGAGFPTGTKWATVSENRSDVVKATVVVNAAEGEPWTHKDRTILRYDPYQVLEGALVAARAVGAGEVVVALRTSFGDLRRRVEAAIGEIGAAGWCGEVVVRTLTGPEEYLFGEETGLLEVLAGRPPFPRIAPPFRRGATEIVEDGRVDLVGDDSEPPPTLVDNVETLAHAAWIVADGPDAFRAVGTAATPGTVVCTVTGAVGEPDDGEGRRPEGYVGEVPAGTTVREAITAVAGGVTPGTEVGAVVLGASTRPLTPEELDLPLCFEAMAAAGAGLGSGTLHVVAAGDVLGTVAGVSRFLAVESCGQCEPCKRDGLALAAALERLCAGSPTRDADVVTLVDRTNTVADGARCALARQHEALVDGLLHRFGDELRIRRPGEPRPIPHVGDHPPGKQPDWTYDPRWSGASPADLGLAHTP